MNTAGSRQQAAGSRQQAAGSSQQAASKLAVCTSIAYVALALPLAVLPVVDLKQSAERLNNTKKMKCTHTYNHNDNKKKN